MSSSSPESPASAYVQQNPMLSKRRGLAPKKKKKKGGRGSSPRVSEPPESSRDDFNTALDSLDTEALREQLLSRDVALRYESERTDKMQQTAEVALRALDSHLDDGQWSTVIAPPAGLRPGDTFQFMDKARGINATAVTVPADWEAGPVLVRLQRTPLAPRLPAPSLGAPPPQQPRRNPFQDVNRTGLVGVASTRPVKFSEDWKSIFKQAGVRKSDLSDPAKAMRIALALAESWDAKAGLPEMPGFTDSLGPLASLSLGPHHSQEQGDDGEAEAEWYPGSAADTPEAKPEAGVAPTTLSATALSPPTLSPPPLQMVGIGEDASAILAGLIDAG